TSSAAGGRHCHIPLRKAAIAAVHAPDVTLPLRFMLFGMACLLSAGAYLLFHPALLVQYHYSPQIVALTHWVVLGFIVSVVSGAVYQLTPVALETRIHSERLARIHFLCQVVGVPGMVAMFWVWNLKQVGHFGSIFGLGVGLLAYNLYRTLKQVERRTPVSFGIGSAVTWLTLTMLVGLFLASAKCWPQINLWPPMSEMHAHAHLGILGCFITLIVGVSYRLVPMFTLGTLCSERRAFASLILLNTAVAGLVVTITLGSSWKLLFAGVALVGLGLFGAEMRAILKARRRGPLDWGLRSFLAALCLLAPTAAIGLALGSPWLPAGEFSAQLEGAYGILALFGVVTLAILGMMQKILPFLVWFRTYAPVAGKAPVPGLSDMSCQGLQAAGLLAYIAGILATATAAALGREEWAAPAWGITSIGVACFVGNALWVLRHWTRALPQAR
ncbi:MAG TPA: hypothetical protein DCM86_10880, partial [Verrucomicrobiales bacterium]|nr:hypothetical protein [Verrucomicrobiales bacterium]